MIFMSRSRKYVFTLNNPTEANRGYLSELQCRYIIYGEEVSPTTGTPHLQGFVVWTNGKSMSATRSLLPGCHIEPARGSFSQCVAYCKKDGRFTERGDCPRDTAQAGTDEKLRWEEAWEAAKIGQIEAIPADIRIRSYGTLKRISRDYQPNVESLQNTCGLWIHGVAGCGKTRAVFRAYPDLYPKGLNKWWCGYQREDVVLLDDLDPTHGPWIGGFLKKWTDRYPFIGEEKGGSGKIRPKKFIITSQYSIEEIWRDEETRAAITRRCIVIEKREGQDIII